MKEHPIIFSGPMVRALLDGRKTQTRRLAERNSKHYEGASVWQAVKTGDRLWVRESHCFGSYNLATAKRRTARGQSPAVYGTDRDRMKQYEKFKWRPSIHMPRWASRLTLVVTGVKIERLQNISEKDAQAEGAEKMQLSDEYESKFFATPHGRSEHERGSMKSLIPPWLWDKFGGRCFYCGSELYRPPAGAVDDGTILTVAPNSIATRDHIIPRSRGGTNARENLALSCTEHNFEKGGSTLDEYRVRFIATRGQGFYGEREHAPARDWLPVSSRGFVKEIVAASVRRVA